ncbi:MAG TPA: hypothetical protein DCE56_33310 [Cyanobacteria bacterium UBA8553]|nr:hypothetical protein [Cyanobacteria bacterium UBA8553]
MWRYWTRVRIDAAGKCKIEEIASVKSFFLSSFPEFLGESEVPDTLIQHKLWHWMREATPEVRSLAECSLKCFISCKIERTCQQLDVQFGDKHGFAYYDLLPFVLDDDSRQPNKDKGKSASTPYQSLLSDILQSFNPGQSSLATWTTRRVKHHKELNSFLLEHGVYLVSDWAILNDTSSKQLQRIFSQFHHLTNLEIHHATQLLESYHAVYRAQRLGQRQAGIKGQCQPPTTEQLRQIQECLSTKITQILSPKTVMTQLQAMASRLREYRIHVRGGSLPTESIDALNSTLGDSISLRDFVDYRYIDDAQTEFLTFYREQFVTCLDEAIAQVIKEQVRKLQKKDPQKAEKFLTALQLFYCQGESIGEIAKVVNLSAQFQVSRLLKLKSFRADIQQQFLVLLRDRVIDEAKAYTNSERLQALSLQIEQALDEQITKVIKEAATEASTATGTKNQSITTSLFTERLCRYLHSTDQLKP